MPNHAPAGAVEIEKDIKSIEGELADFHCGECRVFLYGYVGCGEGRGRSVVEGQTGQVYYK